MSKDLKRKNIKKFTILISMVLLSCFLYFYGISYAKYISDSVWNYYLKSKGFYFSSDYLGMEEVKNVDNLWDGSNVSFNIGNNLNQTVVTNYDIEYNVSCSVEGDASSYAECKMNGKTTNTDSGTLSGYQRCVNNTEDQIDVTSFIKTDCELGGYDWVSDIATKDLYFDVVLTDENYTLNDVVVKVTATSTSPYHKTLSGTFTLHKGVLEEGSITSEFKSYSTYSKLIVTNSYSENKCVNIIWNSDNLVIDKDTFSTYSSDSNSYINEINVNVDSKSSASYIFYSRDLSSSYNNNEFIVSETVQCN